MGIFDDLKAKGDDCRFTDKDLPKVVEEAEALRSGADAVLRKPQPLAELARIAFSFVGAPVA